MLKTLMSVNGYIICIREIRKRVYNTDFFFFFFFSFLVFDK
jgi:hypothetical protein